MPLQEYKIVSDVYASKVAEEVTKLLQEGWQLHGSLNSTKHECWSHFQKIDEEIVYSQVLIK